MTKIYYEPEGDLSLLRDAEVRPTRQCALNRLGEREQRASIEAGP